MPPIDIGTNGIIKQLKNLNQNKATGTDELPARVIKETAEQLNSPHHQQSYYISKLSQRLVSSTGYPNPQEKP